MSQIKKSTLDFLVAIRCNNNREWFQQNKSTYLEARHNFDTFVQELIDKLVAFEPILKGLEAKSCVYRINRDIRFSNDKSPYKTHFGAFIVRGGRKNGDRFAGYYFHIEPGKSIIAGGAYMPPSPWLASIRHKIDEEPEKLLKIINSRDFTSHFGKIEGEQLKTAPKGYAIDHPYIELLRYKSFLAFKELRDDLVLSDNFFNSVLKGSKQLNLLMIT